MCGYYTDLKQNQCIVYRQAGPALSSFLGTESSTQETGREQELCLLLSKDSVLASPCTPLCSNRPYWGLRSACIHSSVRNRAIAGGVATS